MKSGDSDNLCEFARNQEQAILFAVFWLRMSSNALISSSEY